MAAGGDGTVNEVLNGLMEARLASKNRPALGVLCTGRGNDFAPCINIPEDLPAACQVLKDDHRRMIDIGRVVGGKFPQGRYFANNVGVGFDAIGTIEVAKLPEWGMLSFLIAILKTIFLFYKGPTVRLDYDDQTLTTSTLMLLTMNGKRMGTGFKMAPDSKPDDGLFDLVIVRQVSRLRIFSLIPHFMKGTQGTQPEVRTLRGRQGCHYRPGQAPSRPRATARSSAWMARGWISNCCRSRLKWFAQKSNSMSLLRWIVAAFLKGLTGLMFRVDSAQLA